MSYPNRAMPYYVELFHETVGNYSMRFARVDSSTGHGVCHLDMVADWPICRRSDDHEPVLEVVPWRFFVGYDPEHQTATIRLMGENIFEDVPPPRVLAGWIAAHVPVDFALAIVDSFCRTGNFIVHSRMIDRQGEDVEWAVPIYGDHFKVKDATGYLQERIECGWRRRN